MLRVGVEEAQGPKPNIFNPSSGQLGRRRSGMWVPKDVLCQVSRRLLDEGLGIWRCTSVIEIHGIWDVLEAIKWQSTRARTFEHRILILS